MPILVSAAAVQVSFGMEKYLLPHFEHINIYPKEFLRTGLSICFLEGSVTGNSIHLSWKHLLHGLDIENDGHDVALHEMAHAYYYQNFETTEHRDPGFINGYTHFINHGNKVFHIEKEEGKDLYSDYALKNLHEFWAVSVELFFEKPTELKNQHPELFQAIANMLQQTPYIC